MKPIFYYGAAWIAFSLPLCAQSAAPAAAQNPAITRAVGIGSRDGVTISGLDVLVTRNGLTEKLHHELTLSDGARVRPDGTIVRADGAAIVLRPDQLLTFDGRIIDPAGERAPATAPSSAVNASADPSNAAASNSASDRADTKEAAEAAEREAARRAAAAGQQK